MQTVKLNATRRQGTGKGSARKLRAEDLIPAVFYGKGVETTSLCLSPKSLQEAVSGEWGVNSLIELSISEEGKAETAETHTTLLRDYQVHPVTRAVLHADFRKIEEDVKVRVQVPIYLTGKAKGIVMGGTLRQVFRTVPVACRPSQIPARIDFDVSNLNIDDLVRVRDLSLPEGVEVSLPPAQTLGGVYGSRRKADAEEGKEEEGAEKK